MKSYGVRGATSVETNDEGAIITATQELLERIIFANGMSVEDIVSVIFTATPDLDAAYPARAAREMGWDNIPLLCMQEMMVKGSLPRCIRVLLHWNTDRAPHRVHHIYLGNARVLRPDLAKEREV